MKILKINLNVYQNCSIPYVKVEGEPISPIKHLRFANSCDDRKVETKKLEKVVDFVSIFYL
jgi:hypothetical protein